VVHAFGLWDKEMKIKVSDIIESLEKCVKLGVFIVTEKSDDWYIEYGDYLGDWIFTFYQDVHQEIEYKEQAVLVAAIEIFLESRGYWMEFCRSDEPEGFYHMAIIARRLMKTDEGIEDEVESSVAVTRLQAALDAVLAMDWSNK
jgi:hypothetical protein